LLLCVSVAWAALGFLLMAVGLVSLQVAEQKRKRAQNRSVGPESVETLPDAPAVARAEPAVPDLHVAPAPTPDATRYPSAGTSSYDKEAWRQLVESDPDLAQLAAVLADYGQPYVDEFARSYLAAPEKNRIAAIVDEIIAKARTIDQARMAGPSERDWQLIDRKPSAKNFRTEPGRSRLLEPDPTAATPPVVSEIPTDEPVSPAALEPPSNEVPSAEVPSVEVPSDEVTIEPPKPDQEPKSTPMASADDGLTDMIRKFAPDSNFLRKG